MAARFVLAFDQGTTSSRTMVFDETGAVKASVPQEFEQIYPQPGWVEHDPEAIWRTQLETAKQAMERAGIGPQDVAAIGITNQRETTVVWERSTASQSTTPLCGSAAGRRTYATGWCGTGWGRSSGNGRASSWMRIFPARR